MPYLYYDEITGTHYNRDKACHISTITKKQDTHYNRDKACLISTNTNTIN
jgi:hypothetical protein